MKKLFDPDSPILRFLTQAAELAWLNILWVVCSLPVFTLGASTAALCTAVRNMIRESGHWNSAAFFRAFRDNFKKSTLLWLILLAADCDVYIFDEPTKGVDVGAKQDIFHLINEIAKQGNCVIYASCENSELLSLTDRMYVMYNGTVMTELETAKTTEDEIMFYSVGGKDNKNGK